MKTFEDAKVAIENISLLTEERWISFLKIQSTFRSYSLNNKKLILAQNPYATTVTGFKSWKKQGRTVRKGEKALRILAPRISKRKDKDGEEKKDIFGFVLVPVFDITQTEGEDIPTMETRFREESEILSALEMIIADDKPAIINKNSLLNRYTEQLIYKDCILDGLNDEDNILCKALIVESVNYVVSYHYGLPTVPLFPTLEDVLSKTFIRELSEDFVGEYANYIISEIELALERVVLI